MKTSHALLVVASGSMLGLGTGVVAASTVAPTGSPFATIARWTGAPWQLPQTELLEARLKELQARNAELTTLQNEMEDLERRVDVVDGAKAFTEAKKLGIIDEVSQTRPDLRPSAVRRVGVALVAEARKNDLDPLLLAALARVESGFNPFATSDAGARGLLQLTPPTGRSLATMEGSQLNAIAELYDIETNISLGARYLANLTRQFDSLDAALLAYNRGVGGAKALLRSPDGHRALAGYPRMVLGERARLAQRAARLQDGSPL
jgi:soluble lytic murein transglycosylase-like protein